jgi:hypothetical protein
MKGLFLVFIVILFIIYYSYDIVSKKVESNLIYVIGVYNESIVDKKFASKIIELAAERDINLIVKTYDNYFDILKDSNSYALDFAILPEDFYIDSCLGLNVFKDKQYTNNQFVIGLYFNYFYLISEVFYRDETKEKKLTLFSELANFKKVYKRNYVMGTESKKSTSYMNLILILTIYGLNAIPFDDIDEETEYNDNDIFIVNQSKEKLYKMYTSKKLDGIFVLDIQNSRFVSSIVKSHQSLFINFDLEKTIFDGIFSNYYSKKKLQVNDFYTSKIHDNFSKNNVTPSNKITYYNNIDIEEGVSSTNDKEKELEGILTNLGEFNTRSIRNVLISNDSIGGEIVHDIVNIILRNNNFLLNKILYNKFSNTEHGLFEPIDIIYIDKNIRYHKGSRNVYEQMKFLTFDRQELTKLQTDSDEKFDYYWKYSKIGLHNFKFN